MRRRCCNVTASAVKTQRTPARGRPEGVTGSNKKPAMSFRGASVTSELRCAIAHRRISRFRAWSFGPSRNDVDKSSHSRDAYVRVVHHRCPLREEGAGNAGCPMHPQPRARWGSLSMRTSIHSGGTGYIRHSPRNGFNACSALSPVTNSFCHRHLVDRRLIRARLGRWPPRDLTPATGARTTRLRRPQQCHSSCVPTIAHEAFKPALRHHLHARHHRVHRIPHPTFVTIAIRPSSQGGMARTNHRFLKNRSDLFLLRGLDRNSR
jgi:hypothetical protein